MFTRSFILVLSFAALAVGLAGAAFAALVPVNEYAMMEEFDARSLPFDCDGPDGWMMVAIPSSLILLVGGGAAWTTGRRRSRALALLIVTGSLGLISSALPRVATEIRRNTNACR